MTDTLQALENAIQHHIATMFPGALTDAWCLVAHSQTLEHHDQSNYRIITPETQPHHVDAGLIHIGKAIIRDSWDNALTDDYEDDDD